MNPDVIVIGAGVIGTACAHFLAGRGMRVLILERHALCAGASGATAAIVNVGSGPGTPPDLADFNSASHRLMLDLTARMDPDPEAILGGSLFVAVNSDEMAENRQRLEEFRQYGWRGELLDGPAARSLEPLLGPATLGAFHSPDCFHLNPFRLCEGFLNSAQTKGAEIEYGVGVQSVETRGERILRVVTDRGDYSADWVVAAAGAWTPQILPPEANLPIVPSRGQVILSEPCVPMTERLLYFSGHLYLKQTASGNFYLGSHRELVGFENRITLEKLTAFMNAYGQAVPFVLRLKALRFFAGFRPASSDNIPVIGPLPHCPRLMVASGHGSRGVRQSAATALAVSQWIADGGTDLPIDSCHVERFFK